MDPAPDPFGKLLLSRTTLAKRRFVWFVWAFVGVVALGAAGVCALEAGNDWSVQAALTPTGRTSVAVGVMAVLSIGVAMRRFARAETTWDFHENGAWEQRGRRRAGLRYADVEAVRYAVRTAEGRIDRTLEFSGATPKVQFELWTDLGEGESGDEETPTAAAVESVASCVVKTVAERIIERVDRGEVVKWADGVWLDPAGVRTEHPTTGKFVPWIAIHGVKDGGQDGLIQIFAYGHAELVASARTDGINALATYHAFMRLLDRGQASAKATDPVNSSISLPGKSAFRQRPR
jgi:hypothetical protein